MIPLLCLGPRQRSRAASSVQDTLQYHGTRSAPSLGFKSCLRVSGDGFRRCQEENERILGVTACSLSALGKVSFCFASPRAGSSLAYTGRRDQEGARVPFRAVSCLRARAPVPGCLGQLRTVSSCPGMTPTALLPSWGLGSAQTFARRYGFEFMHNIPFVCSTCIVKSMHHDFRDIAIPYRHCRKLVLRLCIQSCGFMVIIGRYVAVVPTFPCLPHSRLVDSGKRQPSL